MTLRELIAEIKKLKPVEQHRLKEFFITFSCVIFSK